jgi:SPP1 gp7 family putative phage head morphogenesis protein
MSVCGSSLPWVSKRSSDMDALDELLADFDTEPPLDPTERLAWIDERSAKLGALMAEAAGLIARNGVEAYAATLVAAGDRSALDSMSTIWRSFVTETVGEYTAGMYLGGNLSTFIAGPGSTIGPEDAAGWASVVNENAAAYQATATNRIVGASNDMWSDVRAKTVESINSGMSGEKLKSQIEDITGYSEFRADTIGRTEAQSAFNGGQLDGARALGEFGPQYKRWMSVGDSRTRKTHERADGQVVAVDDKFEIGTSRMDRPLDRSAPPEESINCRCLMELLWVEDLSDEERDRLGVEVDEDLSQWDDEDLSQWDDDDGPLDPVGQDWASIDDPVHLTIRASQSMDGLDLGNVVTGRASEWVDHTGRVNHHTFMTDDGLRQTMELRGVAGTPERLAKEAVDELVEQGGTEIFRGASREALDSFATGEYVSGTGIYGNGYYASSSVETATSYAGNNPDLVARMVVKPGAKVIDFKELDNLWDDLIGMNAHGAMFTMGSDHGRFAANLGYDVIRKRRSGEDYFVVLNREAMAVEWAG